MYLTAGYPFAGDTCKVTLPIHPTSVGLPSPESILLFLPHARKEKGQDYQFICFSSDVWILVRVLRLFYIISTVGKRPCWVRNHAILWMPLCQSVLGLNILRLRTSLFVCSCEIVRAVARQLYLAGFQVLIFLCLSLTSLFPKHGYSLSCCLLLHLSVLFLRDLYHSHVNCYLSLQLTMSLIVRSDSGIFFKSSECFHLVYCFAGAAVTKFHKLDG